MQTNLENLATVSEVVPFLHVADITRSLRYYVDGLGFSVALQWCVDGRIRWCRLELDRTALMLQEFDSARQPREARGVGISLNFLCADAIGFYEAVRARGLDAAEPFVGNGLWVTALADPDGFRLYFSSVTDAPEETTLSEFRARPPARDP